MASIANSSDSKSLKRPQKPGPFYGPMVYQVPPEVYETKNSQRGESSGPLVFLIIVILVAVGIFLYYRNSGADVRPTTDRPLTNGQSTDNPAIERPRSQVLISARVAANRLYLREGPGTNYVAIYLLPYDWPLSVLGESQVGNDGEVWIKVRLQTDQGPQEGWVSRKYVRTVM